MAGGSARRRAAAAAASGLQPHLSLKKKYLGHSLRIAGIRKRDHLLQERQRIQHLLIEQLRCRANYGWFFAGMLVWLQRLQHWIARIQRYDSPKNGWDGWGWGGCGGGDGGGGGGGQAISSAELGSTFFI